MATGAASRAVKTSLAAARANARIKVVTLSLAGASAGEGVGAGAAGMPACGAVSPGRLRDGHAASTARLARWLGQSSGSGGIVIFRLSREPRGGKKIPGSRWKRDQRQTEKSPPAQAFLAGRSAGRGSTPMLMSRPVMAVLTPSLPYRYRAPTAQIGRALAIFLDVGTTV